MLESPEPEPVPPYEKLLPAVEPSTLTLVVPVRGSAPSSLSRMTPSPSTSSVTAAVCVLAAAASSVDALAPLLTNVLSRPEYCPTTPTPTTVTAMTIAETMVKSTKSSLLGRFTFLFGSFAISPPSPDLEATTGFASRSYRSPATWGAHLPPWIYFRRTREWWS